MTTIRDRSTGVLARGAAAVLMAVCGSAAYGQDSVATTPGASDALSPLGPQRLRYVVDATPVVSSWSNTFLVAPILKAAANPELPSRTQVLGSASISSDQRLDVVFPALAYSVWSTAGAGVNTAANAAPGSIAVGGFDRRFGVAFSDLSADQTNVIGALIGQDADAPARLYVERIVGVVSRLATTDFSTLSLGAVDADGVVVFRADAFNTTDPAAISGDNIVRLNLAARNASPNFLFAPTGVNIAADAAATAYLLSNQLVTLNTPAVLPTSLAGSAVALIFDLASQYRPNGGAGTTTHLGPAIAGHRGNPTFVPSTALGGVGVVMSLGKTDLTGLFTQSINAFSVNASGGVVNTAARTLPAPISDGGFTANASGEAQFRQYLSQTVFRGPNGQVGVAQQGGTLIAAATATDPAAGDFIAAVTLTGAETWSIVAHPGKAVRNGLNGATIGTLTAAQPLAFSAPAGDALGNFYFVGRYTPTGGSARTAFFKATPTPGGYQLERVIEEGQVVQGQNSATPYTITTIRLADADSLASGAFHGGQVLPGRLPGAAGGASSPDAFGGAIVNAVITYNRAGTPEPYEAVLFVGPTLGDIAVCSGDTNGDNQTNLLDLNAVLGSFGTLSGATLADGDVTGDGAVNLSDLNVVLGDFGCGG